MTTLQNKLLSVVETNKLVRAGRRLILAADAQALAQIDKGEWIGGTIPYFMDTTGGTKNTEQVFVTDLSDYMSSYSIAVYAAAELDLLLAERPKNGFTYLLIPAFSEMHAHYALHAPAKDSIYDQPITGWVTGVNLDDAHAKPQIIDGRSQTATSEGAIALHVHLPAHQYAELSIANLFVQGEGDEISFENSGFTVGDCLVNGERKNFAEYVATKQIDTRLPLVADYAGAMINASIRSSSAEEVQLYAPIFPHQSYRFAAPLVDYVQDFSAALPENASNVVSTCNCILNFLYSELEGKHTREYRGAFTFGEIAYILLNQTMVLLSIHERE